MTICSAEGLAIRDGTLTPVQTESFRYRIGNEVVTYTVRTDFDARTIEVLEIADSGTTFIVTPSGLIVFGIGGFAVDNPDSWRECVSLYLLTVIR